MTSHVLCAMFAKALCEFSMRQGFPRLTHLTLQAKIWYIKKSKSKGKLLKSMIYLKVNILILVPSSSKNNGEYNFPMNCVWENNMKLNSLVAAHIIIIFFWLRRPCCVAAAHMLIWAAVSYFIHLASAMAGVVHIYWDPGCKLLVLISIFNVLYGT